MCNRLLERTRFIHDMLAFLCCSGAEHATRCDRARDAMQAGSDRYSGSSVVPEEVEGMEKWGFLGWITMVLLEGVWCDTSSSSAITLAMLTKDVDEKTAKGKLTMPSSILLLQSGKHKAIGHTQYIIQYSLVQCQLRKCSETHGYIFQK